VSALSERARLPGNVLLDRVVLRPLVTPDMEHVTEPACRDDAGARAVVLEQRIGRDRRTVHEQIDP